MRLTHAGMIPYCMSDAIRWSQSSINHYNVKRDEQYEWALPTTRICGSKLHRTSKPSSQRRFRTTTNAFDWRSILETLCGLCAHEPDLRGLRVYDDNADFDTFTVKPPSKRRLAQRKNAARKRRIADGALHRNRWMGNGRRNHRFKSRRFYRVHESHKNIHGYRGRNLRYVRKCDHSNRTRIANLAKR